MQPTTSVCVQRAEGYHQPKTVGKSACGRQYHAGDLLLHAPSVCHCAKRHDEQHGRYAGPEAVLRDPEAFSLPDVPLDDPVRNHSAKRAPEDGSNTRSEVEQAASQGRREVEPRVDDAPDRA